MGNAPDLGHALLETGFVSSEVNAYQLAILGTKEVARLFARSAWAEVVCHGLECRKRRRALRLEPPLLDAYIETYSGLCGFSDVTPCSWS